METNRHPWYAVVAFGPCEYPIGAFKNPDAAWSARLRFTMRDRSGWSTMNTWVYGYLTRATARAADISDGLGQRGRVC